MIKVFTVEVEPAQADQFARKIGHARCADRDGRDWVVTSAKAEGGRLTLRMVPAMPGMAAEGSQPIMEFLALQKHTEELKFG